MTISYTAYVASANEFPSAFIKLLRRWRGSIYQLIYCDLIVFLGIYYSISMSYRFLMTPSQQEQFANVVSYFSQYNSKIPIIFVLSFYVSIVIKRWSEQIFKMPWPDPVATFVSALIRGNDERSRKMRRTAMRYVNLSFIMVCQLISPKVKKRFPTYDSLKDAGILVENEKRIIEALDKIYPKLPKYWMPIVWTSSILTRARTEGKIRDDYALRTLNDSINNFRSGCLLLLHYDTVSIPLVYTQVVTWAAYTYFGASVIGSQWIKTDENFDYRYTVKYYFPLFATLEFFFFMGWLKVAETLICPFGEDDDDFEINAVIDRNINVSYMIVDEMHNRHPQLIKDQYWDEVCPYELPGGGEAPPEHSTVRMDAKEGAGDPSIVLTGDIKEQASNAFGRWKVMTSRVFDLKTISSNFQTFSRKQRLSSISEVSLVTVLEDDSEENGEEETIDDVTFEKLIKEREHQKLQRQQQKILRTVENVADLTIDAPVKKLQMPSEYFEKSASETEDDELQNRENQNEQPKKDGDPETDNEDTNV